MARHSGARWAPLAAAVSALALTAACGGNSGSPTASGKSAGGDGGSQPKVALVQINEQAAFFTQMNQGAQQEAKKLGVDLTIYNANNDANAQSQAIQTYATQGYDAVIFDAIDVEGIKPAIEQAAKSGLKIIAVDATVDDPAVDTQVGVDNGAAAKQGAQWLLKWAKQQNVKPLRIGVVAALNSFIQNERKDQFLKPMKAAGAQILQTVDGENVQETAASAGENLVTAQHDMNMIYATGEPATIGAVAAVKSQNVGGRVKIFGWDLSPQAIQGIDDGTVVGIIQQDPKTEGVKAVEAAKTLVNGGTAPKDIMVPITIVTKANVGPYRSIFG